MQINDRILYRVTGSSEVHEGTVHEFSPSQKYVRLNWQGNWQVAAHVTVVEELPAQTQNEDAKEVAAARRNGRKSAAA